MNSTPLSVVDLVLQANGQQPARLQLLLLAVEVEILHPHLRRPLDVLVEFRDREAALLVHALLVRRPHHLRIDEDALHLVVVLLRQVHGDDALGHADLDGGEPDAGRLVHGLEHVGDELLHLRVDLLDRFGDEPQPLVGEDQDVAQRHAARCKRSPEIGQCSGRSAAAAQCPWRLTALQASLIFCSLFVLMVRIAVEWASMTDNSFHPGRRGAGRPWPRWRSWPRSSSLAVRKMRRADAEAAEQRMAELARLQVETAVRHRRDARHAGRPAGGAASRRQRAARFGDASSQPVDDRDPPAHRRQPAEAQRAARGDRRRAEEHHRARHRR